MFDLLTSEAALSLDLAPGLLMRRQKVRVMMRTDC
jgi:hypothetical protein